MKRFLAMMMLGAYLTPVFAADYAEVRLNITDLIKENKYFLCLYGVGCLSVKAGNNGKVFPTNPVDLGNITKVVITDVTDMRMYKQPNVKSCDIKVNAGEKVTISGHLVVKNHQPRIENLQCKVVSA